MGTFSHNGSMTLRPAESVFQRRLELLEERLFAQPRETEPQLRDLAQEAELAGDEGAQGRALVLLAG